MNEKPNENSFVKKVYSLYANAPCCHIEYVCLFGEKINGISAKLKLIHEVVIVYFWNTRIYVRRDITNIWRIVSSIMRVIKVRNRTTWQNFSDLLKPQQITAQLINQLGLIFQLQYFPIEVIKFPMRKSEFCRLALYSQLIFILKVWKPFRLVRT